MTEETKIFLIMLLLWIIGAILSVAVFVGMIWGALWSAKYFGIF